MWSFKETFMKFCRILEKILSLSENFENFYKNSQENFEEILGKL